MELEGCGNRREEIEARPGRNVERSRSMSRQVYGNAVYLSITCRVELVGVQHCISPLASARAKERERVPPR